MSERLVSFDSADRALSCSYAAMFEQRERWLRTRQGPGRFTYDCRACWHRDQCSEGQALHWAAVDAQCRQA